MCADTTVGPEWHFEEIWLATYVPLTLESPEIFPNLLLRWRFGEISGLKMLQRGPEIGQSLDMRFSSMERTSWLPQMAF